MNRIILTIAISLSLLAVGKTMEVFIKAPGMNPIQCVAAEVEWVNQNSGIVRITIPCGVSYITHISNVVLVERKGIENS